MSEVKQYATVEEYLKAEVFSDEAFVRKLFDMEEPEEVQAALLEKGLEIDIEGIMKLRDIIDAMLEKGGELSPEELDEVAGGTVAVGLGLLIGAKVITGGALVGLAIGAVAVGAVAAALAIGIKDALRRRW